MATPCGRPPAARPQARVHLGADSAERRLNEGAILNVGEAVYVATSAIDRFPRGEVQRGDSGRLWRGMIEDAKRRRGFRFSLRQIRLASGLVLLTYVALHFANHALGNISVEAMERGLVLQKLVWQSPPGTIILYAALFTHMGLGFWAVYQRPQFRWTWMEAAQLALGLFGHEKGYAEALYVYWIANPGYGVALAAALLVVWIHGCLGVHYWLRLKPAYPRVKNALLAFAVLLPTLALLGYYQGGRQILQSAGDPLWQARHLTPQRFGTGEQVALLLRVRSVAVAALAASLAVALLTRAIRRLRQRWAGSILMTYP